jgi:hypothetical protein
MVAEFVGALHYDMIRFPDTGNIRTDLVEWLQSMQEAMIDPRGAMVSSLLPEFSRDPELAAAFRERFAPSYARRHDEMLQRGVGRGELRADFDIALVSNLLLGALYHRMLLMGQPVNHDVIEACVDLLLTGAGPRPKGDASPAA